ncbi:MAG: hypothetical protein ACLFP8_02905 [Alphaproteobacteria bacterium]
MNFKSENGNVLVYILIAVALFAALGFVVTNMMRFSGTNITQERIFISASEILNYGKSLRDAVQFLRISKGCSENQISFERQPFDGSDAKYNNSYAPDDYSCHIFHPYGGGLAYQAGSEDVNAKADWIFTAANDGYDIGNSCDNDKCADLIAILPGISLDMCRQINETLGIAGQNNHITQENNSFQVDPFQGQYSYEARLSDSATNDALKGHPQGCVRGGAPPQSTRDYYFYQVLLAR